MPDSKARQSARDRAEAHRERLRRQGLRPVQFWLPDTRTPEFAAEAHRQSLAIAQSPQEQEDMDFIESISDFDEQ